MGKKCFLPYFPLCATTGASFIFTVNGKDSMVRRLGILDASNA